MKQTKYIAAGILALMMAVTGCSDKAKEDSAEASADSIQIIKQAQENLQSLTSYGFTLDMTSDTNMGSAGTMNMSMKTEAEVQSQPQILMKMESDVTIGVSGIDPIQTHLTQYIEGSDENVTLYQNANGAWSKMVALDPEAMKSLTGSASMSCIDYVETVKAVEEDTVGNTPCQKMDVTLSAEGISQLLGQMGDMTASEIDEETMEETQELIKKAGDIPITLWIGKEDNQIYRQKIDMSKLMKEVLISSIEKDGNKVTGEQEPEVTMLLDITFHSLNEIKEIVIPEEAKAAPEA
jgi:hypothetical protein